MPILLKNYLKRIVERVSGDLIRWDRRKTSHILRKIDGERNDSLYLKVLKLIAFPKHRGLREELYGDLDCFHLLRFRIYQLSDLFHSPSKLVNKIETHEKKVSWQIRRVYRTRNLIVHSGRSPEYIEALIENSHDYLDQTISSIIEYTCGYLEAESLEQIFDMAKLDYQVYIKNLKGLDVLTEENIGSIL